MNPPQDEAAERAVLGAMLLANQVIPDVCEVIRPDDYYFPGHEAIHGAIVALYARDQPVDMVTVAGELQRRGDLSRIEGGHLYLHDLSSQVPSVGGAVHYARQVLDKAIRRRLVIAAQKVTQQAMEADDSTQAAEDARATIEAAATHAATTESGVVVGDMLDSALEWLETPPVTADTPWPDVNERTNGLRAGAMVTVAARPGGGKSLVCANTALFTALQGKAVHVATLEMTRDEYLTRMFCNLGRVNLSNALNRQLTDNEWGRIGAAAEQIRNLPLVLDDRPGQSMAQIRAAARRTARRHGDLGFLGIDYAQLVTPADRRIPREQQVAQISRDTKLYAKEFGCPVMLLAQLNRGNTQRTDPTPMVSDLRESGALEQDSDQVWLLHRPDQYPSGSGEIQRPGEVDLIVGKNRNGPAPVTIPLSFQGHYARIVSMI